MSEESGKPKDLFDKINISASVVSTLVLIVIGILNFQLAEKTDTITSELEIVKTNIETGQLVKSLIDDLKETNVRQDIALIALHRTLAEKDENSKLMVAEIAAQIYQYRLKQILSEQETKESESLIAFQETLVAFRILEEINPKLADEMLKNLLKQEKQNPIVQELIKQFNRVVYIQYDNKSEEILIENFRKHLESQGWTAPGKELIPPEKIKNSYSIEDGQPINTIRYFHATDEARAQRVAEITGNYFKEKQFKLEKSDYPAPYRQIEVWIHLGSSSDP